MFKISISSLHHIWLQTEVEIYIYIGHDNLHPIRGEHKSHLVKKDYRFI